VTRGVVETSELQTYQGLFDLFNYFQFDIRVFFIN